MIRWPRYRYFDQRIHVHLNETVMSFNCEASQFLLYRMSLFDRNEKTTQKLICGYSKNYCQQLISIDLIQIIFSLLILLNDFIKISCPFQLEGLAGSIIILASSGSCNISEI